MSNSLSIPVDEIRYLSEVMAKSGLFGKTPEQIASLAIIAHAEGRPLATVAMEYDVIQGRPALSSRAGLARFQSAGGRIKWIESNSKIAKAEFTHELGGTLEICWTIERAKEIGLAGKDNWKKYPDQMLRARCTAEGIRAVYPACLGALYLVEEVQDFEAPKRTRNIVSKGIEVIVEDEVDEDGRGSIQVSESVAKVISKLKSNIIGHPTITIEEYLSRFEAFMHSKGKLNKEHHLNMMSEDIAAKILDSFDATMKAFEAFSSNAEK